MNEKLNISQEKLQAFIDDPVGFLMGELQAFVDLLDKTNMLHEQQTLLLEEIVNLQDKKIKALTDFIDDLHDKYGTPSLLD